MGEYYSYVWGTGMIGSSGTVRPHLGRVIRDLLRQLHDVQYGMEALVHSDYSREAASSTCLTIIFGRIANGIPWFLRSTAGTGDYPCNKSTINLICIIYRVQGGRRWPG